MMYWTDDPVRDAERYEADKARDQEEYDRKCIKCAWCKKPIRPYEDPYCYALYDDEPIHKDCLRKAFESMRKRFDGKTLMADLFDLMEDAYEAQNEIHTPEPVEGGY